MLVAPARFPRQSWEGRRLALQRKFELNVHAYGGPVSVLTLTAPGDELLPWDPDRCKLEGRHKHAGDVGCRVEWAYAYRWNATAQARASRLWEAAQRSADRYVRRGGWRGELPRQVGHARGVPQQRGVGHWHYLMPQGSETERAWSRHVLRFLKAQERRERSLGPDRVFAAVDREFHTGEGTRGVYGFGFVHGGGRGAVAASQARYVARNAAGYVSGQDSAGHYVSARLTRRTGVTLRKLRAVNYLYVRRTLLERGELTEWVPHFWDPEWAASVVELYAAVQAPRGP